MRTKVIAEIGSNHNRDLDTGHRLIDAAADAGADAVKFQLYRAATLAHHKHPDFKTMQRYEMPWDWLPDLMSHARRLDLECSATPADLEAVVFLDNLDVPWIKIASGDITYERLIRVAAATGRHLLISTGGATPKEIGRALEWAGSNVTVMQCTLAYPCPVEDANLRGLGDFYPCGARHIGFSDHTLSTVLPAVAVGLGATVIEKHFTLSRDQEGPDHGHSLEPDEFRQMVANIREAEAALGDAEKRPLPCEQDLLPWARRANYGGKWLRPADPSLVGDGSPW